VGYFRRWFGNFYTANNRLTETSDYTPFSVPIPVDPRLPGGGGGTATGLYNLVPDKVGQEDLYSQLSSNFGEMTENWHGVDVSVNARLRNGLTVQGGTSSGRRAMDNCAVRAALPETYSWQSTQAVQTTRVTTSTGALANPWCRVEEPFQTSFRGLATYIVPKIDGNKMGSPTRDQYWSALAPKFSAASRHSRFSPSIAGTMISSMSGNWKNIYVRLNPTKPYRVKPAP